MARSKRNHVEITLDLTRANVQEPLSCIEKAIRYGGELRETERGFFIFVPMEDQGLWVVHAQGTAEVFNDIISFALQTGRSYIMGSVYTKELERLWKARARAIGGELKDVGKIVKMVF